MTSFTEIVVTNNAISTGTATNTRLLDQAIKNVNDAILSLGNMQTTYAGYETQLAADVAANPGDVDYEAKQREFLKFKADFLAARTRADNMAAALAPYV